MDKKHYIAPTLKVVSFKVEQGYAVSLNFINRDAVMMSYEEIPVQNKDLYDNEDWYSASSGYNDWDN